MAGLRGRAAYLAYRVGAEAARAVPPALGEPWARAVARAMVHAWPTRRRQVERNLRRIVGDGLRGDALDRAVDAVFANYGRYWYELFRLPDATPEWIDAHFEPHGFAHFEAAFALGRGVVVALPHLGNWDFGGAWLAGRGYPLSVVVEPVEPVELFEWFRRTRQRLGMEVIPLGPHAAPSIARALRAGRAVCLLCDRDLTGTGIEVEFFGEQTRLPAGPATLALRCGSPLLTVGVTFTPDGGHRGILEPPIPACRERALRAEVARVTQAMARRFEALIAAEPEQWLVMQPTWPSDLDGARSA